MDIHLFNQVRVSFNSPDGQPQNIANLATPIKLKIAMDPSSPPYNFLGVNNANPVIPSSQPDEYCFFHEFFVTNENSAVQLKFRFALL